VSASVAAIVGPTAAGKSAAAVEVAERIGAEIISVDSMQLYRGMDVGTDKPSATDRARVRHHLVDVFEPSQSVSVAAFQRLARAAIEEITGRRRLPMLVGGSGLYFRAVVDDLRFPPSAPAVRAALEDELEREGALSLHRRLARVDPRAAGRINPTNARRTVRALEVMEITGERFSANDSLGKFESVYSLTVAGLSLPRATLRARIAERVQAMLDAGLAQEAKDLDSRGMGETARQALGYRQVLAAGPDATVVELRDAIARATTRFARRQESWFKSDPRIEWFDAADPRLVDRLVAFLDRHSRGTSLAPQHSL
jgi:tRNA dimethylallyltransferase